MRATLFPTDYSVLQLETAKDSLSGTEVGHSQHGICNLFRVPIADQHRAGFLFCAAGEVIRYSGSGGCPRFSHRTARMLDGLIRPSLLCFMAAFFVYFWPKSQSGQRATLDDVKAQLFRLARARFKTDTALQELLRGIDRTRDFKAAIKAFEYWRILGGLSAPDGHSKDSPEYAP